MKKLIAYSSISHMGFVTLGIFSFTTQGIQGAVLQMFNHGIVTGGIFLAIGMLYERTHDRSVLAYGGLHQRMPRFVALFLLLVVASFGLPGTGSFIGEFLVLAGASSVSLVAAWLAILGVFLAAAYMMWMFQRVALGEPKTRIASLLPDLTRREVMTLLPLAGIIFWAGLHPSPMVDAMREEVNEIAGAYDTDVTAKSGREITKLVDGTNEPSKK